MYSLAFAAHTSSPPGQHACLAFMQLRRRARAPPPPHRGRRHARRL